MTRHVTVWGVGTSTFGRLARRRIEDIAFDAIDEALAAAELEPSDVDAVLVGNVFGPSGVASRVCRAAGLVNVPVLRIEAACASSTVAVHEAANAVRVGRHRNVLVVGVEHLSSMFDGPIVPERTDTDGAIGLALPALYALQAQRYLHEFNRPAALLADVAVKNRARGALNPRAHWRQAVTADDVLASRPIADPLTLLQCCPMSDGASAAVLGVDRGRGDVRLAASAVVSGRGWPASDDLPWGMACVQRATAAVEHELGHPLRDASMFEVHDAFTIGEIITVEALGLVPYGTAFDHLSAGDLSAGGRWAVNPGGGLLSRGHPLGATGVAQLAEIVWQLDERAGDRQVAHNGFGVVETMGGGASGLDGNVAAVLALVKP